MFIMAFTRVPQLTARQSRVVFWQCALMVAFRPRLFAALVRRSSWTAFAPTEINTASQRESVHTLASTQSMLAAR
jgi:hypothetical protein